MTEHIRPVGIAGTGLIGAGWAARLLIRGFDVIAYDVSTAAEAKLKAAIDVAWPAMRKLVPDLPAHMPGGPKNPLGARALYIGSTLYRLHGTSA